MRKIFQCLLILGVFALLSSQATIENENVGFGLQCMLKIAGFQPKVTALTEDIQSDNSTSAKITEDIKALFLDLSETLAACDAVNASRAVNAINERLKKDNCSAEVSGLVPILKRVYKAYQSENADEIVEQLIQVTEQLPKILRNCKDAPSLRLRKRTVAVTYKRPDEQIYGDGISFTCVMQISVIFSKIQPIYEKIRNGTLNSSELGSKVKDLLNEIPKATDECGLKNYTAIVRENIERIKPVECVQNVEDIVELVKNMTVTFKEKDPKVIIESLVTFVDDLAKILQDCGGKIVTHYLNETKIRSQLYCALNITDLIGDMKDLIWKTVKENERNASVIGQMIQNILQKSLVMLKQCGASDDVVNKIKTHMDDLTSEICLQDALAIVKNVKNAVKDITGKDVGSAIDDFAHLVINAKNAVRDCLGINMTLQAAEPEMTMVAASEQLYGDVSFQCIMDANVIIAKGKTLYDEIKNKSSSEVLGATIKDMLNDVPKMLTDCGLESVAQKVKESIDSISPIACIEDVKNLTELVKTMIQQVKNKDIKGIIENIVVFSEEVSKLLTDCTGKTIIKALNETRFKEEIQCAMDVFNVIGDCKDLIWSAVHGERNGSVLGKQIQKIFDSIAKSLHQCNAPKSLIDAVESKIHSITSEPCLEDALAIVNEIKAIVEHIKNRQIMEVVEDLAQLVIAAKNTVHDCFGIGGNSTNKTNNSLAMTMAQKPEEEILSEDISLQCVVDISTLLPKFKILFDGIKNHSDSKVVGSALQDFLQTIPKVFDDCNLQNYTKYVNQVLKDVNPQACVEDFEAIIELVKKMSVTFKTKDVRAIIEQLVMFVEDVSKILKDCTGSVIIKALNQTKLNETLDCVLDISKIVASSKDLIWKVVKDGERDPKKLTQMIKGVFTQVLKAVEQCGGNENITQKLDKIISNMTSDGCVEDIVAIVAVIEKTVSDIQGKDVGAAIEDFMNLIIDSKNAVRDCLGVNMTLKAAEPEMTMVAAPNQVYGDVSFQCIMDANVIIAKGNEVYQDIKNKSNSSVVGAKIKEMLNGVPNMLKDCGLESASQKVQTIVDKIDPVACIEDFEALKNVTGTLIEKIKNKDISGAISAIVEFSEDVSQLLKDCTGNAIIHALNETSLRQGMQCALDIASLVGDCKDLIVQAIKGERNSSVLGKQIQKIFDQILAMLNSCNAPKSVRDAVSDKIKQITSETCLEDALQIVQEIKQIVDDIKGRKISQTVEDFAQLVIAAKNTLHDCFGVGGNSTQVAEMNRAEEKDFIVYW